MEKKVVEVNGIETKRYYNVGNVGAILTMSTGEEVFLIPYDDFNGLVEMDLADIKAYLRELEIEPGDYVKVSEDVIKNTRTGTKYKVGAISDYEELLTELDRETLERERRTSDNIKRFVVAALTIAALAGICINEVNERVDEFEKAAARFEEYKTSNPGVFESDSIGIAYENPISGRTFSIGGRRS